LRVKAFRRAVWMMIKKVRKSVKLIKIKYRRKLMRRKVLREVNRRIKKKRDEKRR
jgi:hypothetical protein